MISAEKILAFQKKILDRYEENKRTWLPRRDSFDGYKVLVSEVMLQQTQVDRVVPKFERFMNAAPTMKVLSELDNKTLLSLWSWLWFNSRAVRLQQSAQIILKEYWWVLPNNRDELLALPWIWAYCSASLLAFVYNIPAPVVDTNIRRVFIHELWVDEKTPQKWLEAIAFAVTPEWCANDWNNALMDYWSLVATVAATWIKPTSKQSTFAWSKRQVRWNIIKRLVAHWATSQKELSMKFAHKEFDTIVEWLLTEGLVKKDWGLLHL